MKRRIPEFFIILLFCLTVRSQITKRRNEGDSIILSFLSERFSEDCSFNIERNLILIYSNGTLSDSKNYISELENRALVTVEKIHNDVIIVHVSIRSLLRRDKGLYVCVFECPNDIHYKSYKLDIIYPPEPAICTWEKAHTSVSEFTLQCRADSGNPQGTVLCFTYEHKQSLTNFPLIESVSQENILAEFMISREEDVSCCSVSHRYPKHHSECRDFHSTSETVSPQTQGRKASDHYISTSQIPVVAKEPTKLITKSSTSGAPSAIEGEDVKLVFNKESTTNVNFELQYEENPPFYTNNHIDYSQLRPDQRSRFFVEVMIIDNWHNLYLTIHNVSRYDAGTYRCLIDAVLFQEIDLIVHYSPGKVRCDMIPSIMSVVHPFVAIECSAQSGYIIQGYIYCIQNDRPVLTITDMFSNYTTLYQQMWVMLNFPFQCCSSANMTNQGFDDAKCDEYIFYQNISTTPANEENHDSQASVALIVGSISLVLVLIIISFFVVQCICRVCCGRSIGYDTF